ncbi:unnamed protein product [Closterium sp. NIES-65]|nr:unnamed protein product [Closterium sp. NIES-65]
MSPEESNVPVWDQAAGVEANAVLLASTAPGEDPVAPSPAVAAELAPGGGEDDEEDDDDGYLSDDSDEGIDAKTKGVLASKAPVTLTLMIPFELEKEMPAVKPSVKALLVYLRPKLSDNALDGLAFQELLPTYLSHIHFCRLQVTLATAANAEVVRQHRVEHVVGTTKHHFGWLHPVNRAFMKAKSDLPEGVEVLLKGIPAEITPLIVYESLVVASLQKRGRSAFLQGAGFHRVVDPVSGLDTDKIPASLHSAGVVRKILRDPALVLISTGANVEEWLCVQECCECAHGDTFAQAAAHIGSFSHSAALGSAGVATRRLARVTIAWRGVTVTVVATYFPASPTARSPFFRDLLKPFLAAIPAGSHLLLPGDLNIIEDPALDKTSGLGSRGENDRLMTICSSFNVRDAFRALHPCLREYTFYATAVQESTRIDRILLSNALIHQIHDVRHVGLTKKSTDHWSVVHLQLSAVGDGELGPGLWRLPASQVPRPGVQRWVEQIKSLDKRLSLEDVAALSAPWEGAEVKRALAEMAPGKTPGRDGLPKELWESQWDLLGGQMMQFLKDFERTGALPKEFSTAVTVLLHKKGAKDDLQNYRPITLLSTVYKLIGKVLVNRIKNKLESVVSSGQFDFLPGRSIAGAVAVAADVIDAANAGQEDWLMLLFDFRKAFDSVARGYLFDVLRKMGFPEAYVKWVEGLHQGASTRICNDGSLGEEVPVSTGVRQGCPLAPYLFLCAIEPFYQEARRRWLGINVKEAGRLTYLGYADDTTLLLNGRSQLGDAELLLKEFEKMSGLAVNWDKSVVLPLGRQRDIPPPADGAFKWASRDDPERLLGVWITPGGDAKPSRKRALSRMEAKLKKWEAKFLTTTARVTVVNAYVMPIALFQAQIYPPPDTIWEELRRLCHAFVSGGRANSESGFILWNGDLMQLEREEGGLGVINLKDRLDAEALHSLAQLLTEEMPQRRLLAERAADFPLGYASLLAHEALLKAYPFGRRKGDECLHEIMVGGLLMKWADGTRRWKSSDRLARDLGSKQAAETAMAVKEALSDDWKARVLKPLTSDELAEATTVVRTTTRGIKMWKVQKARGSLLYCVKMCLHEDGKSWFVPEGARVKALSVSEVTPMAVMGGKVVGELGEPRSRLLKSELCVGKLAASLKQLREGLGVRRKQPVKLSRRSEWEQLWGKKIDWKRAIARRDSHVVPAKARDVLLRAHCFNLQVGDRLKFLGERAKCPHYGEAESVDHALFSCRVIQPVVGALKDAIRWFNPARRAVTCYSSAGELLPVFRN